MTTLLKSHQKENWLPRDVRSPKVAPRQKRKTAINTAFWNIRLTKDEDAKFRTLLGGNGLGYATPTELVRYLLWHKYNTNKGLGAPKASQWQTSARIGKPKIVQPIQTNK